MKINKVILILFFPVMAQLIFSCCCCDDEPVSVVPLTQTIESIELSLVNNAGAEPIVLPKNGNKLDSVDGNAFGIEMEIFYRQFVTSNCKNSREISFFGDLKACSCETYGPELNIEANLKNFRIITLNDFDSNHLIGADVTAYFKVLSGRDFVPIDQDSINSRVFDDHILLLEKPKIDSIFQFEVSFDVNDTLSLKDTTQRVFLF